MTDASFAVSDVSLDPNVKQQLASNPVASVWVGASAGSGKTKVLTDRVLRLMLTGTTPARILCLTFTKAAAAEMSIRINRTLGRWATLSEDELIDELAALGGVMPDADTRTTARRLFARVVDCPGGMKIQTIHAFCQSLLRRFPLEARLAPHFEVMDDHTAEGLLGEARNAVLEQGRSAPDTAIGRALARLTTDLNAEQFADLLAELTSQRGRIEGLLRTHRGLDPVVEAVHRLLAVAPGTDEADILRAGTEPDAVDEAGLRLACQALAGGGKTDQERGAAIQMWLDSGDRLAGFDAYAAQFLTAEGAVRKTLMTKKPATQYPLALAALQEEAERLVALMDRRRAARVAAATTALLTLADALLGAYRERKAARALLDYDDLILKAKELLGGVPGRPVVPWVLYKLDGGLDHILIDEAQDTNPDQWAVVAAIAEEFFADTGAGAGITRTVFAVGDEKQSIFSFQGADPAEFARMRRRFETLAEESARIWADVALNISFRSTAAVLGAVDAVFAQDAARDGVVLSGAITHRAFRRGQAGVVEVWPTIKPEPPPERAPWEPPVSRETVDSPANRLAAVIADTIAGWLRTGEVLESRGRPIQAGDVMVLVRRRTGFVTELVRALKERAVPVSGVDRMVLTRQLAVMDLMALAGFLLLPEDDLALATVLKGPLIGLGEDELFTLAHGRKGSLWQALVRRAENDPVFRPARGWLGDLMGRTDFRRPYELFAGLLAAPCPADTVSGRRAMLRRLGPDALDPLDEFLAITLAFEKTEPPSLQLFLAWLEASEAEIKREQDAGGGRVRIMTVHGSKGLQAPIVFLPDTCGAPVQGPGVLWPDEDLPVPLYAPRVSQMEAVATAARTRANRRRDQEYRRLLYVALTRAEDRLIVCGWETSREPSGECWYKLVDQAFEAAEGRCGAVRWDFDFTGFGPHGWQGSGWRWKDQQTEPARSDQSAEAVAVEHPPLPGWWRDRAPAEPTPSRPLTPSRPETEEPAVRSPLEEDGDGNHYQRGILVHRLLQTLPDLEPELREAAARRFLARPTHDLSAAQQDRLARETLAVLEDPAFAHLFGPRSRAEVPVVGLVGDRSLSGQIDRLAVTEDAVWVADYKTNRPPPRAVESVPEVYLAQMAAYRDAVAAIYPGRPIRCALIWTDGPFLMEIPAAILDRASPIKV